MMVCVPGDSDLFVFGGIINIHLILLRAAAGDVQAYQIRAAPASTIAPGVVMASSPALPTQGATEEVTRKREVRLMKNRYCECRPASVFFFLTYAGNSIDCWILKK